MPAKKGRKAVRAGGRRGASRRVRIDSRSFARAVQQGLAVAEVVIKARRAKRRAMRAAPGSQGLLVAEGDSWFDYPSFDVLGELERLGYKVESVAHKGDTVEEMAYDARQLAKLARKFEDLADDGKTPRAILFSGGGNDIAGDELHVLLNHKLSGLAPLNDRVVSGILEDRLLFAMISVITEVTRLSQAFFARTIPVLIHGYDFPVPDGRGYLGGWWVLPGPWLEPGFRRKGYAVLKDNTEVMKELIRRFNGVLARLPGLPGLGHVKYVDLRGTLSNDLRQNRYRDNWNDELHPNEGGFEAVARLFDAAIRPLPIP